MGKHIQILFFAQLSTFFFLININAQLTDNDKYDYADGDYYYEMGDFTRAIKFFLKLSAKYPENSRFNYRTGLCYLSIQGEEDKALPYLQNAIKEIDPKYSAVSTKSPGAPPEAWLYLGDALHNANRLKESSQAYHTYKDYVTENQEMLSIVFKRIQGLGISFENSVRTTGYNLTNLGGTINSENSDYNPVLSGDQLTLVFTRFDNQKDKIFISYFSADGWSKPLDITAQVGSKGDCYSTCLSYSGDELFLANYDPVNSDLFVSKKVKGKWAKMVPLDKNINSKYIESGATISADGNTLFFSSDRSGGLGGPDIYYSEKKDEKWSKPVNLGKVINTSGREENPVLSADGSKLFFSSDGHLSIGGMDILWSAKDENGNWQPPVNFGSPVNTPGNDISFWFNDYTKPGYVSRVEENTVGKRDIYMVQYVEPPQPIFEELPVIKTEIAEEVPVEPVIVEAPAETLIAEETEVQEPIEGTIVQIQEQETISTLTNNTANTSQYTIQIMALLKQRDAAIFLKVKESNLQIIHGRDGYYRYTYGRYDDFKQAIPDLRKLVKMGFKDAFIRNIGEINNL